MIFLYCSAGLFVACIVLFAWCAFGEQPMRAVRVLKEMLGGFIVGFTACWLISQIIPLSGA